MSVGVSVNRYPKTAMYNWRTRLKPIGFKLGTLITIRRWSLSLCRLVGHLRPFSPLLTTGEGGGVSDKCPIVSPWLYITCKYEYGFFLSHCWDLGARHFFTYIKPHTWCTEFHSRGIERRFSIPVANKLNLTLIGWAHYKTNKYYNVCVFYVHKALNVPC